MSVSEQVGEGSSCHHLRRWRLVKGLRIGVFGEVLSIVGGDARCAESVKFDRVCVVTEFLSRSFSKSSRLFLLRVGARGVEPGDVACQVTVDVCCDV